MSPSIRRTLGPVLAVALFGTLLAPLRGLSAQETPAETPRLPSLHAQAAPEDRTPKAPPKPPPAAANGGNRIAFIRYEYGATGLRDPRNPCGATDEFWIMNSDGTGQFKVFPHPGQATDIDGKPLEHVKLGNPAFSPDGNRIAWIYWFGRPDNFQHDWLWVGYYDIPSNSHQTLAVIRFPVITQSPTAEGHFCRNPEWAGPSWSPDGNHLVVGAWEGLTILDVRDGADAGANARLITGFGYFSPDWSPDGEWIAAQGPRGNVFAGGLFLVSPNGGDPKEVVGGVQDPAWSPDGQMIAVEDGGVSAANPLTIVIDPCDGTNLNFSAAPGGHILGGNPTWNPGGTRLATWTPYFDEVPGEPTINTHWFDIVEVDPAVFTFDQTGDPPNREYLGVTRLTRTQTKPVPEGQTPLGERAPDWQPDPERIRDFEPRECDEKPEGPLLDVVVHDVSDSRLDVGERFTVRLVVSAPPIGLGFTDVSFVGPPLDVSSQGTILSGPDPKIPKKFDLEPGESRSFWYSMEAVGRGRLLLSSELKARDGLDRPVESEDTTELRVGGAALLVDVTTTPDEIVLEHDDQTVPVEATVTVKNIIDRPIDNVTVHDDLFLFTLDPDDWRRSGLKQVSDGPDPGGGLGTLAPGEAKTVTFGLEASDDGNFEVEAFVTAADPFADDPALAGTIAHTGSASVYIGEDILLSLEVELEEGLRGFPWVDSGETFSIFGVLENRTNTEFIDLAPLAPQVRGNVGGANPIDLFETAAHTECAAPLGPTLAPGERVRFRAVAQTVEDGGTRATVVYTPEAEIVNDDGTRTPIPARRIRIQAPFVTDGSALVEVHVDDSFPLPEEADLLALFGEFSDGFIRGAIHWFGSTFEAFKTLASAIVNIKDLPAMFYPVTDYMVQYWENLSPAQKDRWFETINVDVAVAQEKGLETVNKAVEGYFTRLTNAWYTGDARTVARMSGEIGANVVLEVATCALKLDEFVDAFKVAKESKLAGAVQRAQQGLKALVAGDALLLRDLNRLFGITKEMAADLNTFARSKGLLISIRPRNPLSDSWVKRFDAALKPENIKVKNVNQIDVDVLGYRADDLGSVVFKEPELVESVVRARFDEQVAAGKYRPSDWEFVKKRWEKRKKEWDKHLDEYRGYQENGIPVGFNYADNGIPEAARPTKYTQVEFEMRPVSSPDGKQYFEVYIQKGKDPNRMRRVTGDVDVLDIRKADGTALTVEERLDVYENLQELIGLQHPESTTWIRNGEAMFDAKEDLFAGHALGGEPLVQFAPDGVPRAVFVDRAYSWFESADSHFVWFHGGYKLPKAPPFAFGLLDYETARRAAVYVPPTVLATKHGCDVVYANSEGAQVIRDDGQGGLERWDPLSGWIPVDPALLCEEAEEGSFFDRLAGRPKQGAPVLEVLPQTSLAEAASAGDTELRVNELGDFAPELGCAEFDWFEPGQQIVLDPGGENEELATVAGGGLRLTGPLQLDHEAGEMLSATGPPPAEERVVCAEGVTVTEGDAPSAAFTLTLSSPSDQPVTVDYETADGSATAPDDYAEASGTVAFAPGETQKQVSVAIVDDAVDDLATETFLLRLTAASGASISVGHAVGRILDDDGLPECELDRSTICGTTGDDDLVVDRDGALVLCGPGNDTVRITARGVEVRCGDGNDRIVGGPGNDRLFGEAGRDRVIGGKGKDRLFGGPEDDVLKGGPGNDVLKGGPGKGLLHGGPGKDRCKTGPGKEKKKACER